jgi:hypothetical protein
MRAYAVAAVILAVIFAAWAFVVSQKEVVRPAEISGAPYLGAPLAADYTNDIFKFSIRMPDGFSAQEMPQDEVGAATVLLQNENGEGIQIRISPIDDVRKLSADTIRKNIPDMQISETEEVTVGPDYTGTAFISDNEAFEGASREVWFVYKGNLYQISTYARLDTLLKAMFATWKFF